MVDPHLADLELDPLLGELASRTCTALGASHCAIVLVDGTVYGRVDDALRAVAGRAIAERAVVTAAAGAAVPLVTATAVHGALAVSARHLADEDLDVLHFAAGRAAIAIEHAASLTAERRARRRIEDLQSVTEAALAHLELDELLDELLVRIRMILGADTAAILLLDESTNELVARAATGIEEDLEAGVRIPVGGGFAGTVAAGRRPVILDTVDERHVLNSILWEKGIRSLLGVPLFVEGHVIGVLHVGTLLPYEFTETDVDILQLVADRAALAIEHARVYEAERSARRRVENVQAVTDATLGHLELEDLLDELLGRIRPILGVDTAVVLLLDVRTNELVATAARGLEEEVEAGVRIPFARGFAGTVAAGRQPIILDSIDEDHVLNPILWEKGVKALLGVPLIARNEVIGVLHVGTLSHHSFSDEDVEILQLVAERAAIAIERARLHEEMIRLDELQRNFVAIASHELRTPAASVYGALATLRARGTDLAEETRAQLQEVAWQEADRLRRLIEQLLDLSRLDSGKVRLNPERVSLAVLLAKIVGTQPGIELDVATELYARVDPLVLERVVSNLVSNARIYGEPPITLRAEPGAAELKIVVEDSGTGVPMEIVPRLFERFVRGRDGHGTGLGLAIARAYATAHGGELRYARAKRGARFEIVLPGALP